VNLILLEPHEIRGDGAARVEGDRARHITTVLKSAPGATIRVGCIGGGRGTATVEAASADHVDLRCSLEAGAATRPPVDLLLALPRPKVMRRLWAQIAALGVGRIILTNAERVERNYFDTHVITANSYRPLLIEGLQQAADTFLPTVSTHRQIKVLIEDQLDALAGDSQRLIAHPGATESVSEAVCRAAHPRVLLAVGPEGGWNAFERDLLGRHGFAPVAMGPRTLRSDTAAIALLTLAHDGFARRNSRYP
jgi:RsmE family RNA methyltransferase